MPIAIRTVARNFSLSERDQNRIHEKTAKLNRLLARFPAGSTRLQVVVERMKRRNTQVSVSLTLALPSDVLFCQKTTSNLSTALDGAVRVLSREVERHKSNLRGASAWRRKARRTRQIGQDAPLPDQILQYEEKGDDLVKMVSGLLRDNYQRLLNYINDKLVEFEGTGQVPAGVVDPMEIIETVAITCLRHPKRKPADMSYLVWFYALASRELSRVVRSIKVRNVKELSFDQDVDSDDGIERQDGYDADRPMDVIERVFGQTGTSLGEVIPDAGSVAPDEQAMRGDLFSAVRMLAGAWPEHEREAFELHYVEGLEAYEIAVLKMRSVTLVERSLESVKHRLREAFFAAAEHRQVGVGRMDIGQVMSAIEDAAARKPD